MARRIDYRKAADDRKMKVRGTERIDGLGIAEEAGNIVNKRVEERDLSPRKMPHDKIAEQAQADFDASRKSPWLIIRGSRKLKEGFERFARQLRNQKRRSAKSRGKQ
jgi:hypothetical protein